MATTMSGDDRARVPMLLQDRQYLIDDGLEILLARPATYVDIADGRLYDGPVSARVAVVDLDGSGGLRPPAKLLGPKGAKRIHGYEFDESLLDPDDTDPVRFEDDTFVQLHVFAAVHATLAFFERRLGRRVRWAGPSEQLLVVPRAGLGQNAFYERESGSLQFLEHSASNGRRVLAALSRDVVAHETAHAVLDGIAPDLYDATDPDALTIHEAVGDLAAVLQALLDDVIVFSAYALYGGEVDQFEALGRIAEEFGSDLLRDEGKNALRAAMTDATFRADGPSEAVADRFDPHEASSVVVGAVFAVLRERAEASSKDFERAVLTTADELSRVVVPALLRLPAGEATLVDLARALHSAANEVGRGSVWASAIAEQFRRRGIADDITVLQSPPPPTEPLAEWGDVDRLVAANRELFGIPPGVTPDVTSTDYVDRAWTKLPVSRRRVSIVWDIEGHHDLGAGLPQTWVFRAGTTAVFDADTGVPVSILIGGAGGGAELRRDEQLRRWAHDGLLAPSSDDPDLDDPETVTTRDVGGRCRLTATARTLHIVGH